MDRFTTRFLIVLCFAVAAVACSGGATQGPVNGAGTVTLVTHDSFAVSDTTLQAFTDATGVTVEILTAGDAGILTNQAILTKDNPTADVLYGIDNTFLGRALANDLFVAYESPMLGTVPDDLQSAGSVTPINFGDVCLNYDKGASIPAPDSLDDLLEPTYANALVVENPATSSPGLAFLLSTIAEYGEEGWLDYWSGLVDNGVKVAPDWETAYYSDFTVGGGGDRPLVVSYASSPPAGVIFSEEPLTEAPSATVTAGCFRQVEYAGMLVESDEAKQLIDFMLGLTFQEDIPLNMFVFPANQDAALPPEFVAYTEVPSDPATLDPELIEANRDRWIAEWTNVVLR